MKRTILGVLAALAFAPPALAQSHPEFVSLPPATAAFYRPDSGAPPHVGVVVMHRTANYLTHPACTELSARGFAVLCMNSRYFNNESQVIWPNIALDVKAGVQFLRRQPGIAKVVLFGHSGGGPTMSFYQAVAEHGVAYCQDPHRIDPCGPELAGLPPADGIVFADAHPGQPVMVLRGLNPAVPDESDPPHGPNVAALDAFDLRNGFNPDGASHYSDDFRARFFAGQSARLNRLIDMAQGRRAAMKAGTDGYPDDDILLISRGGNPGAGPAGLMYLNVLDPFIDSQNSTTRPEPLLNNDATISTGIIHSVVRADPSLKVSNNGFDTGTKVLTVGSFLSTNAVRSTNSDDGIDHCSANNDTVCAVRSISVPVMFAGMGAFLFVRDTEVLFDASASRDKSIVYIAGANHGFTPCTACETTPGQYGNSVRNLFDYAADWMRKRF